MLEDTYLIWLFPLTVIYIIYLGGFNDVKCYVADYLSFTNFLHFYTIIFQISNKNQVSLLLRAKISSLFNGNNYHRIILISRYEEQEFTLPITNYNADL